MMKNVIIKTISAVAAVLLIVPVMCSCGKKIGYVPTIGAVEGSLEMVTARYFEEKSSEYGMYSAASLQDLQKKLEEQEIDIAFLPINAAAVVYNKTKGAYKIAAVNTVPEFWLLEAGDSIETLSDLLHQPVYSCSAERETYYMLQYLQTVNNTEFGVTYFGGPDKVISGLNDGSIRYAVLCEPYATIAAEKCPNVRKAVNLGEEWKKCGAPDAIDTVVLISKNLIYGYKSAVDLFMSEYQETVGAVNDGTDDFAKFAVGQGLFENADIASKALGNCSFVSVTGYDIRKSYSPFMKKLFEINNNSFGKKMPDNSIFYEP